MDVFFQGLWWLIAIKVLALFVILLVWTIFNVWYERRLVGKTQHRLGPIMNGPLGLGQALADGMKLLVKEDFRPEHTDKWVFNLAPILTDMAAFTTWTVTPLGGQVEIFRVSTRLQVTDLPVAVLFVLATASIGIYSIVLAGWASSSTYAFLGSMRNSTQMISYEITIGLSIVGVLLQAGTMSAYSIVEAQCMPIIFRLPFMEGEANIGMMGWYVLLPAPSFAIYGIAIMGETSRAPFDLPECESELVSGYLTEYSGFRYAMFSLAEYINMVTVSAVCTTLFLGSYLLFWPLNPIEPLNNTWFGPIWFVIKVQLLLSVLVWLRGTLPWFRHDQFMDLGWKRLIPISLLWIVMIAFAPRYTPALAVALVAILMAFAPRRKEPERVLPVGPNEPSDASAGDYPVPPRPGQVLPELAGVIRSKIIVPTENEKK